MSEQKGLIHIYCGDGKGKTTCSIGLCIRAAGSGMNVQLTQFLKGQPTSELVLLSRIPSIQVLRAKPITKFSFQMTAEEKDTCTDMHNELLRQSIALAQDGACDMLVLDEVIGAMDTGLIDKKLLLDFIDHKPAGLELVLTGRNPSQELLERADYISEIQKIKHPYDKGISARVGIEK